MTSQRIRSALVGATTATIETLLLFSAAVFVTGPALIATRWLGGLFGAGANYGLNRWLVFASEDALDRAELGRFGLTALLSITVSTSLWWVLIRTTGQDPRVLHPIAMVCVWATLTFPMLSRWVFTTAIRERRSIALSNGHAS